MNFVSLGSQCFLDFVEGNIEILGKRNSLFPSGPVIKCLMLNVRSSWNSNVQLIDEAIREIMFWKLNARSLIDRRAWPTESKPSKIVYSDASDYACSSFVENEGKIFQQNWSSDERKKSSTWRELKAVQLAISSFAHDLKGQQVAWLTDNQNVVSIVNGGSRVEQLQSLA